ncbi:MAG: NUDIX hydrolase [Candidatus Komeilibacteria bacterium]|nr:NUDIX hydrolase [Candidatus Komeilibacteria bacterium]
MEWQKTAEKLIVNGYRKIILKSFILPNGRSEDFEIFKEGQAVCVVAITSDNQVVLAKQFRPGPEKVLLELPGGAVDAGETPQQAIKREFLEETGYDGNFQFVQTILDDAYSTRIRHVFVATNCKKVAEQHLGDLEFIEIIEMPLAEFREHLRAGQLTDIEIGYLGLDFLKLL